VEATLGLDEVGLFVRVAEAGSFAAAARALGVPRSTLTRAVTRLEDAQRVRLLTRSPRAIGLTPAGQVFFARVAPLVAAIREAAETLGETEDTPRGTLRLTAPVDLGETVLAGLLRRYVARYPQVRVELDLSSRVIDLAREGFDAAFRAGSTPDPATVSRKLITTELQYFASPAYLKTHGTPTEPADLAHHDVVLFLRGGDPESVTLTGPRGVQQTVRVGATGRGVLAGNDFSFVRALLLDGAGIGPLPAWMGADAEATQRLVRVLPAWGRSGGVVSFVYVAGKHVPRRVTALRDMALETFASLCPRAEGGRAKG